MKVRNSLPRRFGKQRATTRPGGGVQGGEQVRGAVADVVVGALLAAVEVDRQQRLGPVQCLDLGLLVDAEHDRPDGWVQVQADDIDDLVGERRVAGEFEGAEPVRLESVGTPQVGNEFVRHPNVLVSVQVVGHLPTRPVRQPRHFRRCHPGQRDDPRPHRPGDLGRLARPGPIGQTRHPEDVVAAHPRVHRWTRHTGPDGDLLRAVALVPPQLHPRPPCHHRIDPPVTDQTGQFGPLLLRQPHERKSNRIK